MHKNLTRETLRSQWGTNQARLEHHQCQHNWNSLHLETCGALLQKAARRSRTGSMFHHDRKHGGVDRFTCMDSMLTALPLFTDLSQGNWEYTVTKYGLRGLMRTARRSSHEQGIRINYVAPCWIKSAIRSAEYEKFLMGEGIEFEEQEDCASCMMRIACDRTINGTNPAPLFRRTAFDERLIRSARSLTDDSSSLNRPGGVRRRRQG